MASARSCTNCGKEKPRAFVAIYDEAKKVCKGLIPPHGFDHAHQLHGRLVCLALELEGWCVECAQLGLLSGGRLTQQGVCVPGGSHD
jgi:hypothetical protein